MNKLILKINLMMALILSAFTFSAETSFASVITAVHLNKARLNPQNNIWKDAYLTRANELLAPENKNAKQLIDFANDRNTSFQDVYTVFKKLYSYRYNQNNRIGNEDHENYLKAFIEINKNQLGLSQFVLETALACKMFSYAGSYKDEACQAYPILSVALAKVILDHTPSKGLSFQNQGIQSTRVNVSRGLVLVRALLPLYVARTIDDTSINGSNWSSSLDNQFKDIFRLASNEINLSLQDFYAVKIIGYKLNAQTNEQAYSDMLASYDPETIIDYCFEKQRIKLSSEPVSKIVKCSSNHAMAGFLGRLMNRVIQGVSIQNSIREFTRLINKSIYVNNDSYVISDIYRRHEDKGISYSILQLRFLVTAAEIIKNKANYDLYQIYDSKLLKSLDFMAKITSKDTSALEFKKFFNCDSSGYCPEYKKYVSPETELHRLNWARNYGFYILPFKRFCEEVSYKNRFVHLCRSSQNSRIISNVAPNTNVSVRFADMKESVDMGPVQLIFMNR